MEVNVALNRPTTQSSLYNSNGKSHKAVDGSTDTHFFTHGCVNCIYNSRYKNIGRFFFIPVHAPITHTLLCFLAVVQRLKSYD